MLASLNHPNIAQIYGAAEGGSGDIPVTALVMELVDGDDLSARIAHGPLPADEALAIARQIAHALDAAHSTGIVHRDLKPANVKIRTDGAVKVLDFGLAKALDAQGPAGDLAHSPTITSPAAMTRMGIVLGTAAYMSPEQARGRPVDKRADIWAFGCVLYEMLTGRAAFDGETVTDVLGSIVKSEPDWAALPPETPAGAIRLLRRCLQKDAARRLRDIGDAAGELEGGLDERPGLKPGPSGSSIEGLTLGSSTPSGPLDPAASDAPPLGPGQVRSGPSIGTAGGPAPELVPGRRLAWAISVALAAVAATAAAVVGYLARPAVNEPPVQKFHLAIQADGGTIREPVISPDGRQVAYVGRSRINIQTLDSWESRELAGTEAAVRPFWSPDGEWIAYFRSESLLKVPAAGGPVVRIASLPAVQAPLASNSGAWAPDGTIVISLAAGPLLRVPSGGGEVRPFGDIPADIALDLHDVRWLPGGALLAVLHRTAGLDAIGVMKDGTLHVFTRRRTSGRRRTSRRDICSSSGRRPTRACGPHRSRSIGSSSRVSRF